MCGDVSMVCCGFPVMRGMRFEWELVRDIQSWSSPKIHGAGVSEGIFLLLRVLPIFLWSLLFALTLLGLCKAWIFYAV